MPIHKSEDYKLSAVEYYLTEDKPNTIFQSYIFLTRDKNSCINMLSIAKHIIYNKGTRPSQFSRKTEMLEKDKTLVLSHSQPKEFMI